MLVPHKLYYTNYDWLFVIIIWTHHFFFTTHNLQYMIVVFVKMCGSIINKLYSGFIVKSKRSQIGKM